MPFMRPEECSTDEACSIDVMRHAIKFYADKGEPFDYIIMIEPTSPMRLVKDIDDPLERLHNNEGAKSTVSVVGVKTAHPEYVMTVNDDNFIGFYIEKEKYMPKRRQDTSTVYFPEGTVYISEIPTLLEEGTYYHKRCLAYIIEPERSLEIDDEYDMIMIEALMKHMEEYND